jgi:GT2 family glycosyltransferase
MVKNGSWIIDLAYKTIKTGRACSIPVGNWIDVLVVSNCNYKGKFHWFENMDKADREGSFKTFSTGTNLHWLHSCNLGLFQAIAKQYSYVMLLNDDVEISDNFVPTLVEASHRNPQAGIIAPVYNGFWGEQQCVGDNWEPNDGPDLSVNYVDGTCMLIHTSLIRQIGMLDAEFGTPGWGADVDYCYRAIQAGRPVIVSPRAYLKHDSRIGGTSAQHVYGGVAEWQRKGAQQACEDLTRKYGPDFREVLGLPVTAYKTSEQDIKNVEIMRGVSK